MTVGELRMALMCVPDDMTVLTYDEGFLVDSDLVSAQVSPCAPLPGESVLREIWEHSGHEPGVTGQLYFVIS